MGIPSQNGDLAKMQITEISAGKRMTGSRGRNEDLGLATIPEGLVCFLQRERFDKNPVSGTLWGRIVVW
jgi:hypothetical protein